MADDTIASLGFAVDSKPLDDAKAKLKDVSVQAKETGQAVDDFNQKASKLGAGVGNGTKQLAAGLSEAEKAATLAGTSINVLQSIAKRTGESISDVATRVAAARVGFSATAAASAELGTALNVVAPAAKSAAEGLLAKSFAVTELHTAIRAVSPVLNQFGGGLGTILSSATLVRGSFTLLAGVVGGELTIALARSADQITRNEKLFAALAGSVSAGKTALDRAKESARGSNIEFDTMAKAIQQTVQAQTDFANKSIIRARSSDEEANRTNKASDAMSTLGKVIRGTAANSKEANDIILSVSSSLQKTGKFGADELQRIRDISEPAAKELANIFGKNTVKEWADELARAPITVDELIQKLLQVKPAVDAATKIDGLKTFDQAVTQLGIEWRHLLDALANTGAFSGVISAVSALAKVIELASRNTNVLAAALAAIPGANAFAAGKKAGNFLKDKIQASGGGYDPSSDPFGAPMSPSGSSGNPFGDLYDSSTGGFDATDLTGFASGGSFVVGGDGGTDTTNVSFKATKGEVVTIATPDQAATAAALTPVSSTTDIEDLLKDQTKAIVDAINGLKTPSAVASTAVAAVAAVGGAAGGGGVPAFGAGGAGGGGGGSQTPFKKLEEEEKKREQELAARERELSGGGGPAGGNSLPIGLIGGQASALRGFLNHGSSLGQSIGKYGSIVDEHGITIGRPGIGAPTSGDDKGIIRIPQVEKNTSEANRRLNEANQSLDDVGRATASTTRGVESGARDTVEAIGASSSTIASAISSALSSMGQSLMDQGGGSSGGFGGGSGSSGGGSSDYTGGAGFVDSFGLPIGSGFGGSSGGFDGGSSGGFGGPGGGAGNPFGDLYDPSTGGFDASNFVESSGSFAKGGRFTIGGNGGTDTTPVKFWGTKGEQVSITPAGMNVPSNIRVPSAMLRPGASSRPTQHVTTINKNTTINVQEGISAQTFVRSRAQIARGIDG